MAEYIERERLRESLKNHYYPTDKEYESDRQWAVGYNAGLDRVLHSLHYAPAADVVPVVHGKWEYDPNGCDWGIGAWRCSECGCKNDALPWDNKLNPYAFACSRYCPHCGARMDGE